MIGVILYIKKNITEEGNKDKKEKNSNRQVEEIKSPNKNQNISEYK